MRRGTNWERKLPGRIQILHGNAGETVHIDLIDDPSQSYFIEVQMLWEDFAIAALTSRGELPCTFTLHHTTHLGEKREHKTVRIPCTDGHPTAREIERAGLAELREGWILELDNLDNYHRRHRYGDDEKHPAGKKYYYELSAYRYVKQSDEEQEQHG